MKKPLLILSLMLFSLTSFAQKKQLILNNLKPFKVIDTAILIQKAHYQPNYTPPTFETGVKQVLTTPAQKKWSKVPATRNCFPGPPGSCKAWGLVDGNAQYRTVTCQQIKKPANFDIKWIPAKYQKIKQAVLDTVFTTSMVDYVGE